MTQEALLSAVSGMVPISAGILKFKNGVRKVLKTNWTRSLDENDRTEDDGTLMAKDDRSSKDDRPGFEPSEGVDLMV
ncbi:MAG: hypothetical protein IJ523_03215 [Succinivibrionaceae bacterium]|nr:hypothetical protein [Succinivibrionaceae bacterium]